MGAGEMGYFTFIILKVDILKNHSIEKKINTCNVISYLTGSIQKKPLTKAL